MTPAENKQTVEAAEDAVMFAFDVACDAQRMDFPTRVEARRQFVAALRDLVAQADRAAELEAALREILPEQDTVVVPSVPRRREMSALLARLDRLGAKDETA